jgi:hypothetical protein
VENRKLEAGIPIYEGAGRIVLPHGDECVLLVDKPFCFLFFREWIKDFHEPALLLHVVGAQFDVCLFPYEPVHVLGFLGLNNKFC